MRYTYDAMYRMVGVTEGLVTSTTAEMDVGYTYTDDLLTAIEKPHTTYTLTYQTFDLLTSVSIGTRTLATYEYYYGAHHNLKKLAYGNGDVVQYTYDDQGRLTQEDYYENGSSIACSVSYKYDSTGSLASMADTSSRIR